MTFILRLVPDDTGGINGILELVKTGRKARFRGLDTLGEVIAHMIEEGGGPTWARPRPESPEPVAPEPRSTTTNMALIRPGQSQTH